MPVVLLVGTLDTKGPELEFVRDRLRRLGLLTITIDVGSLSQAHFPPDITREDVFRRAGTSLQEIEECGERGFSVARAAEGVASLVGVLAKELRIDGVFSLGGSAGTTIGTAAMRSLPFGVPKVMVSTLASGQTRPYVGGSDLVLFPSVADLAGLNRITRTVLVNATNAFAGMVHGRRGPESLDVDQAGDRPVIAATMFGVTTPCVEHARRLLEREGYEVLVFHATGVGGQAMESLIQSGQIAGVLDLTTTELADEVVGGTLSAGPERLLAAAIKGIPQVVSVGALDMVNFGPASTVPEKFLGRTFHVHNPNVTLMRTTPEENVLIGRLMVRHLCRARGPTRVLIPGEGVSALDAPGKPFHDPVADTALFDELKRGLALHPNVEVVPREEHINDPRFAEAAALVLLECLQKKYEQFIDLA